jgi:uncharacterized protein (TIGR00297 family)
MTSLDWLFLVILLPVLYFSITWNKLTVAGAISATAIGCFIYLGSGFTGIAMIGLFFLLGNLATSWKITIKEGLGVSEKNKGKRTSSQVIANGGIAGIVGLLAWIFPAQKELFQLMIAASLASAMADTLSSELGTLYGKRFFNILSFKNDLRGENGVVSIEGFLIGIIGSALIGLVYFIGFGQPNHFVWILVAGTVGNLIDSILGASLQRKQYLNNDWVNFINTLAGAFIAWILFIKFSGVFVF